MVPGLYPEAVRPPPLVKPLLFVADGGRISVWTTRPAHSGMNIRMAHKESVLKTGLVAVVLWPGPKDWSPRKWPVETLFPLGPIDLVWLENDLEERMFWNGPWPKWSSVGFLPGLTPHNHPLT